MLDAQVTAALQAWSQGDPQAGERVLVTVYDELRRIAARQFRRERGGHTLQATALVHEAFLRLQQLRGLKWESRAKFFAFVACLIRRVLVEHARNRGRAKRGGRQRPVTLVEAEVLGVSRPPDLVALDDSLTRLAALDPRKAAIVELRFFGGLTLEETAEHLAISPETVGREWRRARAWLAAKLASNDDDGSHQRG
jgi:RNA polymerase sigma factor (TIGR02999 family)